MKKVNLKYQLLCAFLPKAYLEIAFSGSVLAYAVGVSSEFDQATPYSFFLFFATLCMYNLLRAVSNIRQLKSLAADTIVSAIHIPIHLVLSVFTGFIALLLLLYLSFDLSVYLLIGSLIFVTLLYRLRWLKMNEQSFSLSELPFLKAFLVAITWVVLTTYIPMHLTQLNFTLLAAIFLFFLALSIPFDVKDIHFDPQSRKTIPQVFGIKNALIISGFLHVFATFLFFLSEPETNCFLIVILNWFFLILLVRINKRNFYLLHYRLLDVVPLFWAFLF